MLSNNAAHKLTDSDTYASANLLSVMNTNTPSLPKFRPLDSDTNEKQTSVEAFNLPNGCNVVAILKGLTVQKVIVSNEIAALKEFKSQVARVSRH